MKLKDAKKITGSLTVTSKMPCPSYSLPTHACITGKVLAESLPDSICGKCYANRGFYALYKKTILPAQDYRLQAIDDQRWVESMISQIDNLLYFRWHDSGDLQSVDHLRKIVAVCEGTPYTKHWIPTRERGIVRKYLKSGGNIPVNLTLRLSAVMFDQKSETFANLPTSTSHKKTAPIGFDCLASSQSGACLNCRACWDKSVTNVSYKAH